MPGSPLTNASADPRTETSDESLMLAASHGDAGAFSTLARRHAARLVMYCMQFTRNMSGAEEVAQEVWLALWSSRATYQPVSRFVVLLFTAARNRCRNAHRGNVRAISALGRPDTTDVDALESAEPSELDRMLASEARDHVWARIEALSPPLREAMVLRVVDELPYADIALIVGIPEATARSRVHLAVEKLRQHGSQEAP